MFGDRLKKIREERNINQADLAAVLNVSQGTIGNWETNKRTPDLATIKRIAEFFNVSIDYLADNESNIEIDEMDKAFFRLKKGLEPYNLSNKDTDFLLSVFKAHKENNK